jgi:hypothetical protein
MRIRLNSAQPKAKTSLTNLNNSKMMVGTWFSACNPILTQLERRPQQKLEDNLKKTGGKWKTTSKKNMKMEDNLKNNGRWPQKKWKNKNGIWLIKIKWKTNQSTKINLNGCDTILNSPSKAT